MTPRLEPCPDTGDREAFLLRTPYREDFVHHLKELVPWEDRRWRADSRAWWIAAEHQEDVLQLVLCSWDEIEILQDDGSILIANRRGERIRQDSLFA